MPTRIVALLILIAALAGPALPASAEAPPAPEILRRARLTAALQNGEAVGSLEKDGRKVPVRLTMADAKLIFTLADPTESLVLDLADDAFEFYRVRDGKTVPLPAADHRKPVRGTDVTYEDLALHFLFWPDASLLKEENLRQRRTWKVRINNPRNRGQYAVVYAWIDAETAALMKVQGYDWQGTCIKQFEVTDVMKVDDAWMLKTMRVESLDGNKPTGRTYLRLEKPERRPQGRRPAWD